MIILHFHFYSLADQLQCQPGTIIRERSHNHVYSRHFAIRNSFHSYEDSAVSETIRVWLLKGPRQAEFNCYISQNSMFSLLNLQHASSYDWSRVGLHFQGEYMASQFVCSHQGRSWSGFAPTPKLGKRPLPDFKPERTRYESVNYGISNYWST